jgi:peroxisome-assembly ATPase
MPPAQNLGLSITNPLVLYRALVSTRKIKPDPAQHRLALQLQKLYFRLKDYAPEIEYRYRLEKISRTVGGTRGQGNDGAPDGTNPSEDEVRQGIAPDDAMDTEVKRGRGAESRTKTRTTSSFMSSLRSFGSSSADGSTLALTRTTPLHDSAVSISSPMGMLLYGEVGRGKSMLLDLLYDSLPSRKKRRWHFNTFMLDIFRRIELARIERLEIGSPSSLWRRRRSLFGGPAVSEHEHVVLTLAKDTVCDSPILFLDEFQMPDRAASKLVNGFFTAFFHLGGVLVASSNRMPEELSKAAGIEFGEMQTRSGGSRGGFWGMGWGLSRASEGEKAAKTDFGLFLDVLRARCEVWEMEGERDWRREGDDLLDLQKEDEESTDFLLEDELRSAPSNTPELTTGTSLSEMSTQLSSDTPAHYHLDSLTSPPFSKDIRSLNPSDDWQPLTLTIYARKVVFPTTHSGILRASFNDLCTTYLGPADYVSLCSTFHTLILTNVPVLTLTHKNEARRFITLLDALYEARCRLLIHAEAPPDKLFFPETRTRAASASSGTNADGSVETNTLLIEEDQSGDSITSEAFSEMYQDSTAPFRPNVSIYTEQNLRSSTPAPSFTASLANPNLRTVLADEDADFGPTYGNGRGHGMSDSSMGQTSASIGPDFTSTSALTGEDERFAYKRARSRLWEMCGRRWWDERVPSRSQEAAEPEAPAWWRPITREGRFWEQSAARDSAGRQLSATAADPAPHPNTETGVGSSKTDSMFRHDASPFRQSSEPPPKFGWQHAWGMVQWGKKAGEWGKGVEGKREKDSQER